MARRIDEALLFQYLLELKEKEPFSVPENIRYLMDAVVTPILNDRTVRLSDLDFDRFDEEALDALEQYVEEVTGKSDYSYQHQVELHLGRLSPLYSSQPVFC